MAVDLADLVPSVRREVSPPGSDLFPDSTDDDWLGQLLDSFWEAKLFSFFADFTASEDGIVVPITGTDDIGRDQQQLVVLFAGIRTVRMRLSNLNTTFRAVAGPVEFETQNSATLLVEILKELQTKIEIAYKFLAPALGATTVYYIDSLCGRTASIAYGESSFSWSDHTWSNPARWW